MKYGYIIVIVKYFISRKFFKAYYGFRVLYVFPFPSAGHWPIGSGRDKVGIRAWVFIADLKLSFCVFLHYCGNRLSNVGSVIFTSSILHFVYFIVVLWFYLVCLLRMRRRVWDAPAAEAADNVEQPFQGEALFPAPRCRGRDSSGREVLFMLCLLMCDFRNGLVDLIWCYSDSSNV